MQLLCRRHGAVQLPKLKFNLRKYICLPYSIAATPSSIKRAIDLCSGASYGVDYAKVERCGGLDEVWGGEGVGVMVRRRAAATFVVCNFASFSPGIICIERH